jgi:SAM-dependent methyltransferase
MIQRENKSQTSAVCPVCGVRCRNTPSARYSVKQAAAHFCPPVRDIDRYTRLVECIRRLWSGDECVVLHCAACGFGFGVPFKGGDEEFYGILHEQLDYPVWRWDYDVAMRAIEGRPGGLILDIGAGTGAFLSRVPKNWIAYGIEGSDTTRTKLRSKRINVFDNMEAAKQAIGGTLDVITLFQVLEHVAEFSEMLSDCRLLLKSGGMLIVTVPEAGAMLRQEKITGCADMPPNHISKWTPQSLAIALTTAGFCPGEVSFEPASWRSIRGAIHLQILADRRNPGSFANWIYRFRKREVRALLLALLAVPALFRLAPHLTFLCRRTAFATVAVAKSSAQPA